MIEQLQELHNKEDLEEVFQDSMKKLTFVFKQSTTCPISADAFEEYQSFVEANKKEICAYFVKVRETREVSNKIADQTGIKHQSPQVLLLKDQEVLWHTSHANITFDCLEEVLHEYA